jgi:hypothetical protein
MAFELKVWNETFLANSSMLTKQYYCVAILSTGLMDIATLGGNAIGILQDNPDINMAGNVMLTGTSKAVYGGNVTAGQNLQVDATGRLVTFSSGAVIALALQSGVLGEVHAVALLNKGIGGGVNTKSFITVPVTLSAISAAMDIVTTYTPAFVGSISKVSFVMTTPVTTGSKLFTATAYVNAVAVTGGVVSLTSAACTPYGKVIDGTAVTATNAFGASDTISLKASAVTAFSEGAGYFLIELG